MSEKSSLTLPTERSPAYRKWMERLTNRFKDWLPFEGPIHSSLTLGSGASDAIYGLGLYDTKEIGFAEIGIPIGGNIHHPKRIVAGYTDEGKKIVVFTGRTAAFEIEPNGVVTETGRVQQMEAAAAYLEIINRVGAENVFLTTAAGGINHPMYPTLSKPFGPDSLPTIGIIGSDFNYGYQMYYTGHHTGEKGDFFSLKDGDPTLMRVFSESMGEVDSSVNVPLLHYASVVGLYEDAGLAHFLAINNVQAAGMTYNAEKTFLSGVNGIPRFLGIVIITDKVELAYLKDPNRKKVITVPELRKHYPWEFFIKEPTNDAEVRRIGALASDRLGKALALTIRKI